MAKRNYSIKGKSTIDKNVELGYRPERPGKFAPLLIGKNARIRRGSIIYAGTKIGDNLATGHNAVVREENIIGDNFLIWGNSTVDYGCKIGNNVKIHYNTYVCQFTTIEDDVFISAGVVLGNDPHPGCKYSKKCMKGPTIKKGAQIGFNVSILPRVTIGENALIGAGSVVTKDIPAGSVAYGNPAKVRTSIHKLKCYFNFTDKPYPRRKEKD